MNIEIVNSLNVREKRKNGVFAIGTHNGIFNADEIIACAILCLVNSDTLVQILRTKDDKKFKYCDVCINIDGSNYNIEDSPNYVVSRFIWKVYGKTLINQFLTKYFDNVNCNLYLICKISEIFDNSFISFNDYGTDNIHKENCFTFISSFLPLWFKFDTYTCNEQFKKALITTMSVLEEKLKTTISNFFANSTIRCYFENPNYFKNGILEIPSEAMDWLETVVDINNENDKNCINFVISPSSDGNGWIAQCVPQSLEEISKYRISFPKDWAKNTSNLSEISGVPGAILCNNNCSLVKSTSKKAIITMCLIATKSIN